MASFERAVRRSHLVPATGFGRVRGRERPGVQELGDRLLEIGHAEVTIQPPGSEPIVDPGKYVVIWRRENGEWKITLDIFNTDRGPQS